MLPFDDPKVQEVGEELGLSEKELKKAYEFFLPLLNDVPENAKKMPGYEKALLSTFKGFCVKSRGILSGEMKKGEAGEKHPWYKRFRYWWKKLILED